MALRDGHPRLSLVIPAHNEEARIGDVLAAYAVEFDDAEIIVVLNGCTDRTADRVAELARAFENVRMLNIDAAVGKGAAVRAGVLASRGDVVGYVDADGATAPGEFRRLAASLGDEDGVIGSRWLPGSEVHVPQPWLRRVASRTFSAVVRLLFGLRFVDTQCGAKVFKASALRDVIARAETSNLAFDVDLLYLMKLHGKRVIEVPTKWADVTDSRIRLVEASLKMLSAVVRLRLRHSVLQAILPMFDAVFPTHPMPAYQRLRVLILNWRDVRHPQAGGAEKYLHEIAKRWVVKGHRVEWLTAGFAGAPRTEAVDGIQITRVGNALTVYALAPWTYLRHMRDRFDVIVDSENGIPFFSPLFSLKPKILVMYHVHKRVFLSQLPPPLSHLLVWVESWLMPRVYRGAAVVACSEDTKREMIAARMQTAPIRVVHSGVDPDLAPGEKARTPRLVYVGRLKAYKRLHLLIEAMAALRRRFGDVELRIAGAGDDEPRLRNLVSQLGLTQCVSFEGFVDDRRKGELLRSAWAYVTPSSMEGWGISVIEANACGTPAVAFDVPGLREAIIDGYSGVLAPEGGDLATSIAPVLLDEAFRLRLCDGALARAREFSWVKSSEEFFSVVAEAATASPMGLLQTEDEWQLVVRKRTFAIDGPRSELVRLAPRVEQYGR